MPLSDVGSDVEAMSDEARNSTDPEVQANLKSIYGEVYGKENFNY